MMRKKAITVTVTIVVPVASRIVIRVVVLVIGLENVLLGLMVVERIDPALFFTGESIVFLKIGSYDQCSNFT